MIVWSLKGNERKQKGRIESRFYNANCFSPFSQTHFSAKRFLMPALYSMECTGVRILNLATTVCLVHHVSLEHSHLAAVLRMP